MDAACDAWDIALETQKTAALARENVLDGQGQAIIVHARCEVAKERVGHLETAGRAIATAFAACYQHLGEAEAAQDSKTLVENGENRRAIEEAQADMAALEVHYKELDAAAKKFVVEADQLEQNALVTHNLAIAAINKLRCMVDSYLPAKQQLEVSVVDVPEFLLG